jgi:hypothetical protein
MILSHRMVIPESCAFLKAGLWLEPCRDTPAKRALPSAAVGKTTARP